MVTADHWQLGATGSVVNDGQLQSAIGGYIALLAPEVRNSGVIVAHMGTVAMASGESVTLTFVGAHLAGISVKPAAIAALVENRGAVIAPGGVIILSAQAVDHLLGGVVKNSGTLEATGLSTAGGRIVLNASDSVTNSGTISADADSGGTVNGSGPAGSVTITAPAIQNSGRISAAGSAAISVPTIHVPTPANGAAVTLPAPTAGGHIALSASSIVQTATGTIDASGGNGGSVVLAATQDISAAGTLAADAVDTPGATRDASVGHGGSLTLTAAGNVTLQNALLDASGPASGGEILIQGGGQTPLDPPIDPPTLALLGGTLLNTSSRRGKGGSLTLTADRVGLFDTRTRAAAARPRAPAGPPAPRAAATYSWAAASMAKIRPSPMHSRR